MIEENNKEQENLQSQQNENSNALEHELKECKAQKEEWRERFLRLAAEFENYKKRAEKERTQWIQNAHALLLGDILAIVDDFDRAFAQQGYEGNTGFELIHKALQKMLEKYGVTEIKDISHFDPMMHEAIMQVEDAGKSSGEIAQVLQKGYLHKGEVLRPAKVSVVK